MADRRETGGDYCGTVIAYEDLIASAEGARVETGGVCINSPGRIWSC